jgi:hypothetical protein
MPNARFSGVRAKSLVRKVSAPIHTQRTGLKVPRVILASIELSLMTNRPRFGLKNFGLFGIPVIDEIGHATVLARRW